MRCFVLKLVRSVTERRPTTSLRKTHLLNPIPFMGPGIFTYMKTIKHLPFMQAGIYQSHKILWVFGNFEVTNVHRAVSFCL